MRVLYDSHVFDLCRFGGISQYYAKLWQQFPEEVELQLSILESENIHLRDCGFDFPVSQHTYRTFLPNMNFRGKFWFYNFLCKYFSWIFHSSERKNECNFRHLLYEGNYDLIHLTGIHGNEWVFKVCARLKKPIVVTCFDLIPEMYYGNKVVQREHKYAYAAATHIITISQNTKDDLCDFYKVAPDKVDVTYLGCDVNSKLVSKLSGSFNGLRYVLFVGRRDGYKNFNFFVRAVVPILKNDPSLLVVCTGPSFSKTECILFEQLGMKSRFVHQFVSDVQFPQLYHNAVAFVFPSLYEGFGLPILDAFANGCPVLIADASCFPEVGGDAALYFDPKDEEDFRRQLVRIIGVDEESKRLRENLIVRGKERACLFTWKRCANETAEVYRRVINEFGK